jgi:hypothetical protein
MAVFRNRKVFLQNGALIDDADSSRKVYGIKEPCFDNDPGDHPKNLIRTVQTPEDDLDASQKFCGCEIRRLENTSDQCTNSAGSAVPCTRPGSCFSSERVLTDPLRHKWSGILYNGRHPQMCVSSAE